jgi:transcriptional regulator GlxA family with amidase domain
MADPGKTYHVGIYIYDKVEVLDFAGPFEVFTTASRVHSKLNPEVEPLFNVFTIADSNRTIHARGNLQITPSFDFNDHPPLDVLIVPGGIVADELHLDYVVDWIRERNRETIFTASVCTGAFLLAKAGLLDGKSVTTHWEDIPDLREMFPQVNVLEEVRWVDTGRIISSAGISAGIDMSLHLVERLGDKALAAATARQMEFDWQDSGISV